ncbi:MAG TPA: CapA family protein, partial [Gaiella sp.]|nr:CapA family protein [Gaiella sp.]
MRVIALIVRAGAVVALSAVVVALLVDGTEQPAAERAAVETVARPAPRPRPTVPAQPPTPVPISITATGDIAFGAVPDLPPDDGRSFFADVQADLAGDVVVGNLEGTLADRGVSRCAGREGCRPYRVPTSYAARLGDAGFTVVSLANDHAYDFGEPGLRQTVDALSAA